MKKNPAFTLIEIVIATSILTITVFWIYKLIWENSKIINNSNISVKATLLFPIIEACIENLNLTSDSYIFIWNDYKSCEVEEKVNIIDNINYTFYARKINDWIWETAITSDFTWTQTWFYTQKK
jgi:hypothetical protein